MAWARRPVRSRYGPLYFMLKLLIKEIVGSIPTSVFEVVNDKGLVVGFVQIRHKPSSGFGIPTECASHIYYEIDSNERGKGYGKVILKLALSEAKKIGINPVIVTCDEDNLASLKVIKSNRGSYDGFCLRSDNKKLLRFKFNFNNR